MERIIINEVDNTSNVETLSSYDVVYVPGFSTVSQDSSLFRTPTLITSKYQFLQTFGDTVPTFSFNQYYKEATTTSMGFPTYAIPDYAQLVVEQTPIELDTFTDGLTTLETYYTKITIVAPAGEDDWTPDPDLYYYIRTGGGTSASPYVMTYTVLSITGSETYVSKYGSQNVYVSKVSPRSQTWYEVSGGNTFLTGDTQITPSGTTTGSSIKNYYSAVKSTPPMFYSGDADPGYRYALYLLSLGIPVYYEQMNSVEFEELDLTSDWNSSLIRYGTSVTTSGVTDTYISPYNQGWYYKAGNTYKKCEDDTIKYRQSSEVTTTWYAGADMSLDSMYSGLEHRFMEDTDSPDYSFDSIGDYSVKYITSGGYPTFEYGKKSSQTATNTDNGLAYAMISLAAVRGDAVALIDHTNNPDRSIYETDKLSVIYRVREEMADYNSITASYGTMFTPWYTCSHSAITGGSSVTNPYNSQMPGSLGFLSALSTQVKNYNPWLAVSGVTRGKIPYFGDLHTNYTLTNNVADSYQTVPTDEVSDYALISINPITYIRQYGYCIWGNRTLRNNKSGTKATSFLNIRNTVSDIKKSLYEASQKLLFEQNTDVLWINFKSLITPQLDTMVSNNILSDYQVTKYNVDPETGEAVPAYKILAVIKIRPINSVEVFDLSIQLENTEITVSEVE